MQLVSADFAEHLRRRLRRPPTWAARRSRAEPAGAGAERRRDAAPAAGLDARPRRRRCDDRLRDVKVRVSAELGRARLPVGRVVNLPPGAIVKLDRSPADAHRRAGQRRVRSPQARLVLVDGEYAVQIVSLTPLEAAA